MLSSVYISEIASARVRGGLVAVNQLAIVTGLLVSYITNLLLLDVGAESWRWMFAVESIPAFIFTLAIFSYQRVLVITFVEMAMIDRFGRRLLHVLPVYGRLFPSGNLCHCHDARNQGAGT